MNLYLQNSVGRKKFKKFIPSAPLLRKSWIRHWPLWTLHIQINTFVSQTCFCDTAGKDNSPQCWRIIIKLRTKSIYWMYCINYELNNKVQCYIRVIWETTSIVFHILLITTYSPNYWVDFRWRHFQKL